MPKMYRVKLHPEHVVSFIQSLIKNAGDPSLKTPAWFFTVDLPEEFVEAREVIVQSEPAIIPKNPPAPVSKPMEAEFIDPPKALRPPESIIPPPTTVDTPKPAKATVTPIKAKVKKRAKK